MRSLKEEAGPCGQFSVSSVPVQNKIKLRYRFSPVNLGFQMFRFFQFSLILIKPDWRLIFFFFLYLPKRLNPTHVRQNPLSSASSSITLSGPPNKFRISRLPQEICASAIMWRNIRQKAPHQNAWYNKAYEISSNILSNYVPNTLLAWLSCLTYTQKNEH